MSKKHLPKIVKKSAALSLKIFWCLAILFFIELKFPSADDARKSIRLLATSDLHGWLSTSLVYPERKSSGLLYLANIIETARAENPDLILVDGGDLLQGSPLVHYYNRFSSRPRENPFFRLFRSLNYDAVAVGNHDLAINPVLERKYLPDKNVSWLSANIYRQENSVFSPFKILTKAGLKVAVIGFSTPGTIMWTSERQLKGMKIRAIGESAAKWLPILKNQVKADLIIGVFHAGLSPFRDDENSKLNGIPPANNAYETIKRFPEFDLAIVGHDHRLFPARPGSPRYIGETPVIGGGSWGKAVMDVTLHLRKKRGQWQVEKAESRPGKIKKRELRNKIDREYINSLTSEYKKYLLAELPWKISRASARQAGKCLNLLNAMAQDEPEIVGTMLPEIATGSLKNNIGERIRRLDLFRWLKYDNKSVTIKVSARDIFLLKNPPPRFGSRKIPYNRKLFPWFKGKPDDASNSDKFSRRHLIKISEYHFMGGGGVVPMTFIRRDDLVKTSDDYSRDRLFDFLKKSKPILPSDCGFLKYDGPDI